MRSIRAHEDLQNELNGRWFTQSGAWHWEDAAGTAGYSSNLSETLRTLRSWGGRVEPHTVSEIKGLEPSLALSDVARDEVYLLRDEGWVQVVPMIESVLAAGVACGLDLVRGEVSGLSGANGGVDSVVLSSGEVIDADLVFVCAGPASNDVASLVGRKLRLELTRGAFAVTCPVPSQLRRVVISPDVIVRPDGGGRLICGSEATLVIDPTPSVDPSSALIESLHDKLADLIPNVRAAPFEAFRLGTRVVPFDGLPIVGPDNNVPGLYYVVTHSGITLSAGLADLVVEDLAVSGSERLQAYRPDRALAS